jgi:uncharacterized membrane protein YphA (DoxX/SURF4 family)
MLLLKRITSILLAAALGLIFLYSGYTKLVPVIETFEFSFVDFGVANWYTAPIIARVLIALEIFTGLLLVANYRLKQFTLPLTAGILVFFILYLILQITSTGNSGNCGCFGEHIQMTPLEAIIKNILMLLVCLPLYLWNIGWSLKKNWLVPVLISPLCIAIPFILNPVDYSYTSNNLDETVNYPLELDLLYHPEDSIKVEIPKVELRTGKQVVAFLSLTCSHCRVAAKKFRLIKKENPALPIYFVLNGDHSALDAFLEDTHVDNIPYSFCLGKTFVQLSSAHLPRIYYLNNGMVVKKVDYFELSQYQIEDWIQGKEQN